MSEYTDGYEIGYDHGFSRGVYLMLITSITNLIIVWAIL